MIIPPYGVRETRLMPEAKQLDTRIAIIAEFNESKRFLLPGQLCRCRERKEPHTAALTNQN
jgi:hypothetical protein